jgi:Domain of unknown function (DUF4159)
MSRIVSLLFVLTFAGALHAQPEPLVNQVKTSITKGVAYLVKKQAKDGSWDAAIKTDENKDLYQGGTTALALLALLQCGAIDDAQLERDRQQAIARGLDNLRRIESARVYVRALQTMALVEAKDLKKDRAQIERNVRWLLEARVYLKREFIGWEYDNKPGNHASDASNSQYAMLALWYARQAGVAIPRDVWEDIRSYYTRTQSQDGFWIYSPYYGPNDEKGASVTMTVAGLCGLQIASMELNGGREQWQPNGKFNNCGVYGDNAPIANAQRWLNKNFRIDLPDRAYYHLYGLERAGRLTGLRFFGEHDWYREGSEYLVKKQETNGSWKTHGGWDRWPHVNTAFALLFLSKGRTPVLVSKLVHGAWKNGRNELDLDWNNDRNDLRHLTDYLATTPLFGKQPLAWQTYDIRRAIEARLDKRAAPNADDEAAIVAEMLQTPILYITGHESLKGRFQDLEKKLIKRYVENGGFIFAEACCGSKDFDDGIKEWVKSIWDENEEGLKYIESTHAVWDSYNKISPGDPYKLMSLQVGCRTVMLYSPQDLSCRWESNNLKDGPTQRAFELGANIVAYATGRTPPQPRLTPIDIAGSDKEKVAPRKRGYFQVGQIRHSADWQPAPKAMSNLMEHVHKDVGLDVMLRTEQIRLTDPSTVINSKFLYLHGRDDFRFTKDQLEPLRFTLENGGLLLADACCGDQTFDKAFRKFAQEVFPKEKLVRLAADSKERDPLFGAALNRKDLSAANIKCRTKANGPMAPMEPFLEGIKIDGRWVVLYSKYDIGCALERNVSGDCVGYDHASALLIATAAVRYNTRP